MGNGQVKALIFRRLETFSFILKALLVWKVLPEGTCQEPGPAVPALAAFGVTLLLGAVPVLQLVGPLAPFILLLHIPKAEF